MARSGRDPGFRVIVALTDQFTRPIQNLNNQIAQSTAKIRALAAVPGAIFKSTGLTQIGGAVANVGQSVLSLRNAIAGTIAPFARLGVIAGGVGLGVMVTDAVKAGGELIKMSHSTGIAVEALQRLTYAGKQESVSAEAMTGALAKMNMAMANATKPAKKMTEAQNALTKGLGFTFKQMMSGSIDTREAFLRLADRVAATTSQTNKMRIAGALLGKGAKEMLPLLNLGRKGIEALGEGAAVMSTQTARSAKAFGDTMTTLAEHAKGLAYDVLQELLPSMNSAAGGMDKWLTANKEWLKTEIVSVIRDLVGIAKAAWGVFQDVSAVIKDTVLPAWAVFEDVIGKNNARLLLFTAVVAPKVLLAVLGIGKALAGLALALAANPIGAAIIGIGAAVGYLGYSIYKERDTIAQAFAELGSTAQQGAALVAGNLADAWEMAPRDVEDFGQRISRTFGEIWTDLSTGAVEGGALVARNISEIDWATPFRDIGAELAPAADWIKAQWGGLADWFGSLWGDLDVSRAAAAGDNLAAGLTAPMDWIKAQWSGLTGWFSNLWDDIAAGVGTGRFDNLWDGIVAGAGAAATAIGNAWTGADDWIKTQWAGLTGWFGDLWAGVEANFTTAIGAIMAATAGFIPQPITDAWGSLGQFFSGLWSDVVGWFEWAWGKIKPLIDLIAGGVSAITGAIGSVGGVVSGAWNRLTGNVPQVQQPAASPTAAATTGPSTMAAPPQGTQGLAAAAAPQVSKSEVSVNFSNVPQGTRISEGRSTGNTEVSLRSEYAGPRGALAGAY